jgi:hypothetical protein
VGGTTLVVTGTNFFASANALCRFNEYTTSAAVTSTSILTCVAPPHVAGAVSVLVANNGQDFTATGPTYTYTEAETVESVYPISGPSMGSTTITVNGANFLSGAQCVLRSVPNAVTVDTWASVFVSATRVTCVTTAQTPGAYFVEISNNVQDISNSRVEFVYYSARFPLSGLAYVWLPDAVLW